MLYSPLGITETFKNKSMQVWVWAVGQAASVSEVHVGSSVTHVHSGVASSVVTQSSQAWARSLRIMPPAI